MSENDVGYKKPPQKHRFRKGVSGNPRGRPKDRKSQKQNPNLGYLEIFNKMLSENIEIREAGCQKQVTKQEAFLKKLFADAMNGDKTSIKIVMRYIEAASLANSEVRDKTIDEIVITFVSPKIRYEDANEEDIIKST